MTREARRGYKLATFVRGKSGMRKRWKNYEWTGRVIRLKISLKRSSRAHRGTKGVSVYTRYVFNGLNGNEKRCGLVVVKGRVDWKLRVTIVRGG